MTAVENPPLRVSLDEKLNVQYCIEGWLRDEQIKLNTTKLTARVRESKSITDEPIALVNYGPSLNDTWEKIKEFKKVMSCSGAHKFLMDRDIVPTYHIDVDPRPHKIQLIGTPNHVTEYLIASTCSPQLFDFLLQAGCNVKLWHIFDTSEDGLRLLPHGEWAITGGCSVGVRTLTMARFLGFTNLHVFGMDGCEGPSGKHAAAHPNQTKKRYLLEYDGKEYWTTPAMLEAAKNTWHELDMMKDTKVTFHGEGLVQHMSRNYQRKEITKPVFIGFSKEELISSEYRELNRKLHAENLAYGVGGGRHADVVLKLYESLSAKHKFVSILDYGCGKGYLGKALPIPIAEYDPALPGKTESPKPADLVCCFDVLEHIEPDKVDFVIEDLHRCTKRLGYFIIHTGPSGKNLPDGRNSHLIQEGKEWWLEKLSKWFIIPPKGVTERKPLLHFIAARK